MTMQEMFDKVVNHLFTQGCPAVNKSGGCMYLSPEGKKCAIGIFIPDGHPAQDYMGPVKDIIMNYPDLEIAKDGDIPVAFMRDLQDCHDRWSAAATEDWRRCIDESLMQTAKKWNLNYTPGEWKD